MSSCKHSLEVRYSPDYTTRTGYEQAGQSRMPAEIKVIAITVFYETKTYYKCREIKSWTYGAVKISTPYLRFNLFSKFVMLVYLLAELDILVARSNSVFFSYKTPLNK